MPGADDTFDAVAGGLSNFVHADMPYWVVVFLGFACVQVVFVSPLVTGLLLYAVPL